MNRLIRVADVIEKYFPAANILHKIPNYTYQKYHIMLDKINGTMAYNDFTNEYSHIDIYHKEDILAMNVHHSLYDIFTENEIAKFVNHIINDSLSKS